MRIALADWQNKANFLTAALTARGHEVVSRDARAHVFIQDTDFAVGSYRQFLKFHKANHAKCFLYTHGAGAYCMWDGIWTPQAVDGYFAMYPGAKEIMRRYGYPYPVHVIGWHYCALKPFQPVKELKRILFAPWHPHQGGYLYPPHMEANARILADLAELRGQYEITVRHLHTLEQNGLTRYEGIHFIEGQADNSYTEIDRADLVIAVGTYARLAIARGKPTYLYGQAHPPHESFYAGHYEEVKSWEKYRAYMRYPFSWEDESLAMETVLTTDPHAWKALFIGEPFDGTRFVDLLEDLVGVKTYA